MNKEFVGFIFGVAVVCIAFWIYGFDFDKRGELALNCFAISLLVGIGFAAIGLISKD